jgi:hypothetical protein
MAREGRQTMNTSAFGARCAVVLVAHEVNNGCGRPQSTGALLLAVENGAHRHQATRPKGNARGAGNLDKSESERQ